MNGESSGNEFLELIEKCLERDRSAQKKLYTDHYGFAMSVCLRYCKTKEEAQEVLNNGFLKVFKNLEKYVTSQSFKNWFKRILINASIDFYRSQQKHYYHQDINTAYTLQSHSPSADSNLRKEDLMELVNALPLAYKTNFCLFAIDGYSHDEISKQLGISVGTSKSNVSRARKMLRTKLETSSVRMNIV
ncbi:MAG: RNA polymerase sigma factor (sigma-70 family) [Arcticibacterium sp.]|jgi:RNA polymerase sigma factor (sigma-70 family)